MPGLEQGNPVALGVWILPPHLVESGRDKQAKGQVVDEVLALYERCQRRADTLYQRQGMFVGVVIIEARAKPLYIVGIQVAFGTVQASTRWAAATGFERLRYRGVAVAFALFQITEGQIKQIAEGVKRNTPFEKVTAGLSLQQDVFEIDGFIDARRRQMNHVLG